MNKKEYYEQSKKEKLPLNCPIIGKCERYAMTYFYMSQLYEFKQHGTIEEYLINEGILNNKFPKEKIDMVGPLLEFNRGNGSCYFCNMCPEVALFFNGDTYGYVPEQAISSGKWDKSYSENEFGKTGKFKVLETKHYSECHEFSQFNFRKKRAPSTKRTGISKKLRFEIFQRDNFTCQYCKRSKDEDEVKLQLDHIIPVSKGGTDAIQNLITSCLDCNLGKSNKII